MRSAGAAAQIMGREDNYALVKLPSGEVRKILEYLYGYYWSGGQCGSSEYPFR